MTIDLLRADLYRLLDEVAHARGASRELRVAQFEDAWRRFKQALAGIG